METATFGAGCFWGVEAAFRKVDGVIATRVGYAGGDHPNPTYQDVCGGETGHAEVVQLDFDPDTVSYDTLLEVYWDIHDPTTLNRQGPDVGTQYRSVIFFHNPEQEAAARASLAAQNESGKHSGSIAIEPASSFHMAEDYHQQYFEKRGAGLRSLLGV